MKHELLDGSSMLIMPPSGPGDSLTVQIEVNGISKGMVCLDPNTAAAVIRDMREAFAGFTDPRG